MFIELLENLICKMFNLVVFNVPKGVVLCKTPNKRPPKMYVQYDNSRLIKSYGSIH